MGGSIRYGSLFLLESNVIMAHHTPRPLFYTNIEMTALHHEKKMYYYKVDHRQYVKILHCLIAPCAF